MKALTQNLWLTVLLVLNVFAQNTNTYQEQSETGEEVVVYIDAESDSILQELSYIPVIPKGLDNPVDAEEMRCFFTERDTDSKYVALFYSMDARLLNMVVYYDGSGTVELYGVNHDFSQELLAMYVVTSLSNRVRSVSSRVELLAMYVVTSL